MRMYESGRESRLLLDIRRGLKTVECRLNRGKFAKYKVGDQVWLREDIYHDGKLSRSIPKRVLVEITKVESYISFKTLIESVGYKNAVPRAHSVKEAVMECYRYYSPDDESKYGTLAIFFRVMKIS